MNHLNDPENPLYINASVPVLNNVDIFIFLKFILSVLIIKS